MAEFFRTSTIWVIDFRYEGRSRRWFLAFGAGVDVRGEAEARLTGLYGDRARLVEVRRATDEEERQYLGGTEPKNVICPTGRRP